MNESMYLRAEIGDVPASHVRFRGVTSQWAELRVLQESAKSALYFNIIPERCTPEN